MSRLRTVNEIVNAAALEVGLSPSTSPFTANDENFQQLIGLLNSAGQELSDLQEFPVLQKQHTITTKAGDTGDYPLPDDFNYMIDQTGWNRSSGMALGGPLNAQDWTYLNGRGLGPITINVSFRLQEGKFRILPNDPVPEDVTITFEYISTHWLIQQSATPPTTAYLIQDGDDLCVFDSLLLIKFLKLKFLQAKGLDASYAAMEFDTALQSRKGKEAGAPILSASQRRGFPYLDTAASTPDTGFGP